MKFKYALVAVMILIWTTGCSVFMAAKGPDKKDVTVFNKGTPRAYVIAECGQPAHTTQNADGTKTDIFTFVQGYSSGERAGRALFHGAADILTLGVWEVLGTPLEAAADNIEVKVQVDYDVNDRVKKIQAFEGQEILAKVANDKEPGEPKSSDIQPAILPEKEEMGETTSAAKPTIAPLSINIYEPWTGKWTVEGPAEIPRSWELKQRGSTVVSTEDSSFEIEGRLTGNYLKGRLKTPGSANILYSFQITLSPDGRSFSGTAAGDTDSAGIPIEGIRKE